MNKWFNIYIENPFKTWWKARKYFKVPDTVIRFKIGDIGQKTARILDLIIQDVQWKDKFGSPRHEDNPKIEIILFGFIMLSITPTIEYYDEFGEKKNGNLEYWEYLLDYVYYHKNLKNYGNWHSNSELYEIYEYPKNSDTAKLVKMPIPVPTVAMSLNKEGIKQLKIELK